MRIVLAGEVLLPALDGAVTRLTSRRPARDMDTFEPIQPPQMSV